VEIVGARLQNPAVTVKANSGSARSTGVVCTNGSKVATITVSQASGESTVTYDRSSMVTAYKQITNTSCAATCAAMCVNKSQKTLQDAGFDLENADWSGIAAEYGYTTSGVVSATSKSALNILKSGYPVIVKINSSTPHWVVITKYSGSSTTIDDANFTCIDPWDGTSKKLTKATSYSGISKSVTFK